LSADAARDEALRLRNLIRDGRDPLADARTMQKRYEEAPTVGDLCKDWLEAKAGKRSIRDDREMLSLHVLPGLARASRWPQ
jgi:hypothetical protein